MNSRRLSKRIVALLAGGLLAGCASTQIPVEPIITDSPETDCPALAREDFVPDWAKGAIWYQVFPDRFHNGDPSNDPTLSDLKGAWPDDQESPWQISPWGSDWYELQPWERETGQSIWWNIQRRRYGGDLQGILDKLDYLENLGVTAIYLNPIFVAPSLHKYDGASYHHVEPTFGPDPEGDRALIASEVPDDPSTWKWTAADKLALELINEVHRRDMHIIFDGVFNHMGINSWAFQDVVINQQESKYRDWFTVKSWDNPMKGTRFDYEGWFGVKTLPELREDENGIVDGPKQYIFDSTRRWMDPNGDGDPSDGIDGWRLDVAFCVGHPFWKDWRKVVKSINPEAYTTAEIVDPIEKVKPYLEGDEFDAVMNYNFAFTCSEYFVDEKNRISTSEFDKRLRDLREAFDPGVAYVQQNLFGSHDTNRLASHIVNRDKRSYRDWGTYFGQSQVEHNGNYDTRKPTAKERESQKLFALFQMTYLGAPMVYYGDEVGMWGANDPDCRKPMVWLDIIYDDEVTLANGEKKSSPDSVYFDQELHDYYRKLIHIRRESNALKYGSYETLITDDTVYAFKRTCGKEHVLVFINNDNKKQERALNVLSLDEERFPGYQFTDLISGKDFHAISTGPMFVNIPARSGLILVNTYDWERKDD